MRFKALTAIMSLLAASTLALSVLAAPALAQSVPAAPANLAATTGDGQVTLDWDDPSDSSITGYDYRVGTTSNGTTTWSPDWGGISGSDDSTTSYTVTGLTNDTAYTFEVRAVNANGDGTASSVTATPIAVPGAPAGLWAEPATGQVTLRWDDPSDAGISGYEYRVGTTSAGVTTWSPDWGDVSGSDATTVSHVVTGLTDGTAYDFEVRAVNASGDGTAAAVAMTPRLIGTVTSDPLTAPSAASHTFDVSGSGFDANQSLNVIPCTVPGATLTPLSTVLEIAEQASTMSDTDCVLAGTLVVTTDASGDFEVEDATATVGANFAWAVSDTANTQGGLHLVFIVPAPGAPAGLWAEPATGQVTLRWDDPSDAGISGYEYRVGTTSAGVTTWSPDWGDVSGSDATTVSHVVTGLTDGTVYDFEVRAVNTSGDGTAAAVAMTPRLIGTVTSDPLTAPSAASHTFDVSGSGFDANQSLNVIPCTVPGATLTPLSTVLEIAEQASTMSDTDCVLAGTQVVTTDASGDFEVEDATATVGANFAWAVSDTANTQGGLHLVFIVPAPGAPAGLWAEPATGQVTLRWDDPSDAGISGYEYRVGTTSAGVTTWSPDWGDVSGSDATTVSHVVTGLTDGTVYDFEVRAVNTSGDGTAAAVAMTPRLIGTVTSDPLTAPSAASHTFDVSGSGFDANQSLNVIPCTVPGATLTPLSTVLEIAEQASTMSDTDCVLAGTQVVTTDASGDFEVEDATATVGANFAWAVSDTANTQGGLHLVFIVPAPGAPAGLWAEPATGQVTLRWDDPSDAGITGYEYRVGTTSAGVTTWSPDWGDVSGSDATTVSHVVTGLTDGTAYDFEVRAANTSGGGTAAAVAMTPRLIGTVTSDPLTAPSAASHTFDVSGSGFDANQSLNVIPCTVPGATLTPLSTVLEIAEQASTMSDTDCVLAGTLVVTTDASGDFEVEDATATVGANFAWAVSDTANTQGGLHLVFIVPAPGAPAGLWAEPATGQVTLRWDDPSDAGITGYEYRVGTTSAGVTTWSPDWGDVSGSDATTVSHVVTGLTDGTAYDFEVRAVNTSGDGTAAAVAMTPRLIGTVTSDPLTAPSAASHTFDVSGSGFDANQSLNVIPCTVPGATLTPLSTVLEIAEQASTMSDTDCVLAGTQVVTTDASGDFEVEDATATVGANFAWAVSDTANTQGGLHLVFIVPAPGAPAGLWAEPATGQVTLRWDDPSDAGITGYEYRVGTTSAGVTTWSPDWGDVSGSDATTVSHVVTGLTDGTAYDFEVRAVNTSGGGTAAAVAMTPRLIGTVTSDPLTAPSAASHTFDVSGSGFDANQSLNVIPCTVPGATLTPLSTVLEIAEQASTMSDTDCVLAGTQVVTTDASGDFEVEDATATVGANFAWAVSDTANTQGGLHLVFIVPAPGAPAGLWAEPATGQVTLRWDDPSDAGISGYEYRVGTTSAGVTTWSPDWGDVSGSDATTVSHVVTGLTDGTAYDFEVRAANTSGGGTAAAVAMTPRLIGTVTSDPLTAPSAASHTFDVSGSGFDANQSLNVIPCTVPGATLTPLSTVLEIAEQASTMSDTDCVLAGTQVVTTDASGDFEVEDATATVGANFAWAVSDTANTQGGLHLVFIVPAPGAPAGLWAEPATGQVTLRWDDPSDAGISGYEYRVGTTSAGVTTWSPDWGDVSGSDATTVSHVVTGLTDGTAYDFEVRAVNTSGGGTAAAVAMTPRLIGTVTSDPLTAPSAASHTFDVSGSGFDANQSLNVIPCTVPGATLTPLSTVLEIAEQASTMSDTDCVLAGTQVVTTDASGDFEVEDATATVGANFAWAVSDTANTQGGLHLVFIVPAPGAPAGLWAEPATGQVTLRWDDPSDAGISGYEYRVGTTSAGVTTWSPDWGDVSGSDATTVSHVVTGLTDGTAYDFEVRAVNTSGGGTAAAVAMTPRLIGTVTSDPLTAPSAASHTFDVSGSGFDANQSLNVIPCTVPGATLTPLSTVLEIAEQASTMSDTDCVLAGTLLVTTDASGDFEVEDATATVGANFAWAVSDTANTQGGLHLVFIVPAPGAPAGLWAEPATGQVTLRWDDPSDAGISGYEYRVGTTSAGVTTWSPDWGDVSGSDATTVSHVVTGLTDGTAYDFEVRAANTSGGGTAAAVAMTPRLIGTVTSDPLTAPSAASHTFDVSGSGFDANQSLNVIPCTVPGATLTPLSTVLEIAEQASTMSDTDCVLAGTQVVTTDASGDFEVEDATATVGANFAWAVSDTANTQGGLHLVFIVPAPGAPAGLWAEPATGQVTLRWDDPSDAGISGYEYRVGTTSAGVTTWSPDWGDVSGSDATTVSHVVTGLTDGTAYDFEVRAVNTSGGGTAAAVAMTPRLIGTVTSDPLTAPSAASHTFDVSGSGFDANQSLNVIPCTVPGATLTPLSTVLEIAEQASTMSDTDCVLAGTQVVTTDASGDFEVEDATATVGANFAWAVSDTANTQGGLHLVFIVPAPGAPAGLWAEPATGQVTLRWDDPSDAGISGYEYRVGTTSAGVTTWSPDWGDVSGSDATTVSHVVTGLTDGTAYDFEVRAVNTSGGGTAAAVAMTPRLIGTVTSDPLTAPSAASHTFDVSGSGFDANQSLNVIPCTVPGATLTPLSTVLEIAEQASTMSDTDCVLAGTQVVTTDASGDFEVEDATATVGANFAWAVSDTANTQGGLHLVFIVPVPGAPAGLWAEPATGQVTLRWDDPSDAGISGYEYRVGTTSAGVTTWSPDWGDVSGSDATTVSHVVTGLTDGTAYDFEVRAANTSGGGTAAAVAMTPRLIGTVTSDPLTAPSAASHTFDVSGSGFDANQSLNVIPCTVPGATLTPLSTVLEIAEQASTMSDTDCVLAGTQVVTTDASGDFEVEDATATVGANFAWAVSDTANTQGGLHLVFIVPAPGAPANLTATAGDAQVTLSWDDPSDAGITGYEYRVGTTSAGVTTWSPDWGDVSGSDATTVSHVVTGLTNGTAYDFEVRAANTSGGGTAASATATPIAPPGAPANLTATAGDAQVELSWDDPSDTSITGYEYRVGTTSAGVTTWSPDWGDVSGSDATTTSYTVTGLTNDTAYTFEVRAVNASGDGTEASATATPIAVPGAPANLAGAAGDAQVELSWDDPSDTSITGYEYRVGTTATDGTVTWSPDWGDVSGSDATTTSYTVTGLTNDTAYTFEVRAVNASGGGTEASVTATPIAVPGAPANLTATAGDAQVTLSWDDPSDAGISGYEYRVGTTSAGVTTWSPDWGDVSGSDATTVSHVVTGLTNDTAYTFEVRAVNASGDGTAASATATPIAPPGAPANLTATAGDAQVELSWDDPSDTSITGYEYRVGTTSAGVTTWSPDWGDVSGSDATTTSYTVTGLTNDTAYTFEVRAVNASGDGTEASATATPIAVPGAPANLAGAAGDAQVELSWDDPSDTSISGYEYRVGTTSAGVTTWSPDWGDVSGSDATTTSYTVTGLTNDTAYTFEVRAVNASGGGTEASVTATPIAVPGAPAGLWAEPATGQVTLRWDDPSDAGISGYEYRVGTTSAGVTTWSPDWGDVSGSDATTVSHVVTGLTDGTVYDFEVRAVNASGDGTAAAVAMTPRLIGTVTSDPLTAPSAASHTFDVSGSGFDANQSLNVIPCTVPGATLTPLSTVLEIAEQASTMSDTDCVLAGTQVVTTDASGDFEVEDATATVGANFAWAVSDTANTQGGLHLVFIVPAPGAPAGLWAEPATGQVTLRWDDPSDAGISGYEYRVGTTSAGVTTWSPDWGDVSGSDATTVSHVVTGLTDGTAYDFEVRAVNTSGGGTAAAVAMTPRLIGTVTSDPLTAPSAASHTFDVSGSGFDANQSLNVIPCTVPGATLTPLSTVLEIAEQASTMSDTDCVLAGTQVVTTDASGDFEVEDATATVGANFAWAVSDTANTQGGLHLVFIVPAPGAPAGLWAEPATGQVTLRWDDPSDAGISGYEYRVGTTSAGVTTWSPDWGDVSGSDATTVSHVVTGLTDGTAYDFEVRAVNTSGGGTAAAVAMTPRLIGTVTSDPLTAPSAASHTFDVSGSGFDANQSLNVIPCTVPGATLTPLSTVLEIAEQASTMSDTDCVLAGTQVVTTDASGDFEVEDATATVGANFAWAVSDTANTQGGLHLVFIVPAPGAPAGLWAEPATGQVTLRWDDPSDAGISGYEYRVGTTSAGVTTWSPDWGDVSGSDATTVSHVVTGLTDGTAYDFEVRAVNTSGGGTAAAVAMTPRLIGTVTSDPLTAPSAASHTFDVSGSGFDANQSLNVIPCTVPGATLTPLSTVLEIAEQASTMSDTDCVLAGTQVVTTDASGDFEVEDATATVGANFAWAVSDTANTQGGLHLVFIVPAPGAPANLTATAGDAQVTLSWDDPSDAGISGYEYRVGTTSAGVTTWSPDWGDVSGSDATTVSHVVTGLTNGTAYDFEVRAANTSGGGTAASATATPIAPPGAPANLTATAGDAQVELSWDDPSDTSITGYEYRVGTTSAGVTTWSPDWGDVSGSDATTTSYTVTGLTNDTAYTFEVRAVNASGDGTEASATATPIAVPGAPANLAGAAGDAQVELSWDDPSDTSISGYEYRVGTTSAGVTTWSPDWGDVSGSDATTTSYTVTGLTNDTAYTFEVRAVNASGGGTEASVTATPIAVPGAPAGLWAEPATGQVTLRWDDPSDAGISGYEYRVGTTSAGVTTWSPDWGDVSGSDATTVSHVVTGLTDGTVYDFEVRAVNASGDGTAAAVAMTPRLIGTVTSDPLTAPSAASHTFDVSGSGFDANQSLNVIPCTVPGATLTPLSTVLEIAEQASTMSDTDCVLAGTQVVTTDASGDFEVEDATATVGANFAWAVSDTANTQGGLHLVFIVPAPGAPANLTATAGDAQVELSWDDPSDAGITGYEYRVGTTSAGVTTWSPDWGDVSGSDATTVSHVVTGLTNGTAYDFEVRAANTSGGGTAASATATPIAPPGAPANLTATAGDAQVELSWDDPSDTSITGYEYRVGTTSAGVTTWSPDWGDVSGSDATTTSYTVTGLTNDTAYTFEVRAVNASGDGTAASATATPIAVPGAPAGLWAEPATGQVTLRWDDPSDAGISGYEYRVGTTSAGVTTWSPDWGDVSGSDATTVSHVVTGLTDGTVYDFEVRAVNTSGGGTAAAVAMTPRLIGTVTSDPLTAPSAASHTFDVSGSGFDANQSLNVIPCTVPGATLTPLSTVLEIAEQASTMSDTDCVLAGTLLVTTDASGDFEVEDATATVGANFAWAVSDTANTQGGLHLVFIVPAPGAPAGLWAEPATGQVTLRWDDPSDAGISGYEYRVGTTSAGVTTWSPDWGDVSGSDATTVSHVVTGLTDGTAYDFEVRAVNTSGGGTAAAVAMTPRLIGTVTSDPLTAPSAASHTFDVSGSGFDANQSLNVIPCTVPGATLTPLSTVLEIAEQASTMSDTDCVLAGTQVVTTDASGDFEVEDATATVGANFAWAVSDTANTQGGLHLVFIVPAPGAPANLTATAGDAQVTLSWDDPSDAGITGYEYRVGTTSAGVTTWSPDWGDVSGSDATTVSHVVTGLTNGTAYDFEVRAANTSGGGTAASATATPIAPPGAPANLAGAVGDAQVTLSWDDPSDSSISGYEYRYSSISGTTTIWHLAWTNISGSDATTTSHVVTGLTNGTEYTFEVRAVNASGGGTGASVTVTPIAVPGAPANLAGAAGDAQVTLSWDDPSDTSITGYEYRVGTTTSGTTTWSPDWGDISGSDDTTTSYTVTGLTNDTEYTFEVRAVNISGDGTAASATATPIAPPAAPDNLTATAGNAQVELSWDDPSDTSITGYEYRVGTTTSGTTTWSPDWGDISGSDDTTTSYTVTGLTNDTEYTFEVRAVNASGDGTEASVTATPSAP